MAMTDLSNALLCGGRGGRDLEPTAGGAVKQASEVIAA